jgi:transcriptional regulator with XRE-family HTH domain
MKAVETPQPLPRTRLTQARRNAGLSQKELATRAGMPLWMVDQFEKGKIDVAPHELTALANATGAPFEWLRDPTAAGETRLADADATSVPAGAPAGHRLVLSTIAALVLVRFFTEVVPVAPRAVNFIDVPLFIVLAFAALRRAPAWGEARRPPLSFAIPVVLFLGLCAISVVSNPSRVEVGPVLVFIYGFLAPLGVFAAVYRLWPAGQTRTASRLLVALGVTQLIVVAVFDLPRFVSTGNPDVISGTFGTNAYQLVFFMLVFIGVVAGTFVFEPRRPAARAAPALFALSLVTIFLAQYRALLVATAICIIGIGWLLGRKRKGMLATAILVTCFVGALTYVASEFPGLKFASTVETFQNDPGFYAAKRLEIARMIGDLYSESPRTMFTGTGPGTFSSRAWYTFARAQSTSASNVAGTYVSFITGGNAYHTDVSDRYIAPRFANHGGALRAVTSPFSSYTSLLAEVGVFGFVIIAFIYFRATSYALRRTFSAVARGTPGDPLPGVLIASSVAFVVLVQMALLDNWLEVTRATMLAWALLAITAKEYSARSGAEA